jgi:hypothetical protein
MKNARFDVFCHFIFCIINCSLSANETQQSLTQINGWNVCSPLAIAALKVIQP